jgi:Rod binding domain-containing protein
MSGIETTSPIISPLGMSPLDPGDMLAPGARPTVRSMAENLETMFMSMLLKEMRQALDATEGGLFSGDNSDIQGGLFDFYLGKHLADSGGIGLASVWMKQLEPSAQPERLHDARAEQGRNSSGPSLPYANSR